MKNFEKTLNEILVRNGVNLKNGLDYYDDCGHIAFISYKDVVEKIKAFDDDKKQNFIKISNKLEKEHKNITNYLDLVANTLM